MLWTFLLWSWLKLAHSLFSSYIYLSNIVFQRLFAAFFPAPVSFSLQVKNISLVTAIILPVYKPTRVQAHQITEVSMYKPRAGYRNSTVVPCKVATHVQQKVPHCNVRESTIAKHWNVRSIWHANVKRTCSTANSQTKDNHFWLSLSIGNGTCKLNCSSAVSSSPWRPWGVECGQTLPTVNDLFLPPS